MNELVSMLIEGRKQDNVSVVFDLFLPALISDVYKVLHLLTAFVNTHHHSPHMQVQ